MAFQQNYIYPLKVADRYDDEFGEGFDYALLADYGAVQAECWVHDAWIVKANGEIHTGLSESPVPVRLEDVEEAAGRPFDRVPVSE